MPTLVDRIDAEATQSCAQIKARLDELIGHVREDIVKTNDPRARALFETTAEVLAGLKTAFVHYEAGIEPAFQPGPRGATIEPLAPTLPAVQADSGGTILGES
jgi:hypothetical protein